MTKTCEGIFVSILDELKMLGTICLPVPNMDICLESIPEIGYYALSKTPHGEVIVCRDTLFSGYHKCDDHTIKVLVDG